MPLIMPAMALPIGPFPEDAEDEDGEEGGCGQAEGQRHHLGHEARRVDAEVAGDDDGDADHDPADEQALLFRGLAVDDPVVEVVGDGRGR
jgi:hypothetical protein